MIKGMKRLEQFLSDYELNFGNAEVVNSQDGEVFMTIEAPNHTTLSVIFDSGNIRGIELGLDTIIYEKVNDVISDFDVDETFVELWSETFGNHNSFTPRTFINVLEEDEAYFYEVALSVKETMDDTRAMYGCS